MKTRKPSLTVKHRNLQKEFLQQCIDSSQTLDEILADLEIPFMTLSGWLTQRGFREKLTVVRRSLQKLTRFQVALGANRAAAMLARIADEPVKHEPHPTVRNACVDLIRLSRDSRTRSRAGHPTVDQQTKHRSIYHPDVPAEDVRALIDALTGRDRVANDRTD